MPESEGYILACAPSGVGALGGQINDDPNSLFAFANRNSLTGENDNNLYNGAAVTNGINLFGFTSTGHMIPVIQSVGDKIDLIAYQGYNAGGSTNRSIMYDAYAYYANQYGFSIAAGVHYPNEPWGPYYEYTHTNVASLSNHILQHPERIDSDDGIMIWQILLENPALNSSAYSYMNVASMVLGGTSENTAIQNANNYSLAPYTGGAQGCNSGGGGVYCGVNEYNISYSYPEPNTQVYYECKIWYNQWYANPNEVPGVNSVWVEESVCYEDPSCIASIEDNSDNNIIVFPIPSKSYIQTLGANKNEKYFIYNTFGHNIESGFISDDQMIDIRSLSYGLYFLKFENGTTIKFLKN